MTCGIYMITTPSGDRYVGASKNIEHRWTYHQHRSPKNRLEVLEECPQEMLDEREWAWMFELKPELNREVPYVDEKGDRRWRNLCTTNPNWQKVRERRSKEAEARRGETKAEKQARIKLRLETDPQYRKWYEIMQGVHARKREAKRQQQQAS